MKDKVAGGESVWEVLGGLEGVEGERGCRGIEGGDKVAGAFLGRT